ncbi:PLDc N-terminal domain-containing protein [Palaeococcus sp. (in: euryarchaeotes)]
MFVFFGIFMVFWLVGLLAMLWVIYDVLTKQKAMPDTEKLIWVIVAIFLNWIGAIIYFFVIKREGKYEGSEPPVI